MRWVAGGIAGVALLAVGWAVLTAWPAIVHGHPAYAILLALTALVAVFTLWLSTRPGDPVRGWRRVLGVVAAALALVWIAGLAWLRPFPAVEPAVTAMVSDSSVLVEESPTQIQLTPTSGPASIGVVFQPGARVDARAYAAILRPLAEAGYEVLIPKQPLGIPFLSMGAFEAARDANPQIERWVVGGHSLGGTIAAMDAEAHDTDVVAPVAGLMLYASYPASDMRTTLTGEVISILGTNDGLATPARIGESQSDLPESAEFVPVEGAVHSFFGDYGPQPGDGTPTISHDDARREISERSVLFLAFFRS